MDCREAREWMTASADGSVQAGVERHLNACGPCSRYAARLRAARAHFGRRAEVEPPPAFAARIAERLRHERAEVLGRAALRLMPAALALLLLAGWLSLAGPDDAGAAGDLAAESGVLAGDDNDDLMSWLLEEDGDGR